MLSLIAVVIVVVLAGSFTQYASSVSNRQAQAVYRKQAFYMAEAGLAEAYGGLMCGKSGNVGTKEEPAVFGDGLFWVEANELEEGVVKLDAVGMVGCGQAKLSVVAERGEETVASLGVFSKNVMSLLPGSVIDAYDSSLGTYASQNDHGGVHLGSNDTISLTGQTGAATIVQGDVTPGPGFSVAVKGDVTITGSTAPSLEPADLPAVEVPEVTIGGPQAHDSPYPLVLPPGESGYKSLSVAAGSQVVLQGPATIVIGALVLDPEAELAFDTEAGPVALYITESLQLAKSSILSTSTTTPEDVIIQVAGETAAPVELRASSTFNGVFYAPEAETVVGSGFEVFGALIGGTLTFEGDVRLHFDKKLASVSAEAALPRMLSWRIIDLASSSTDLTTSPFEVLGVDPNTLPPPKAAHADQMLDIRYLDNLGFFHSYTGWESSFDWNVVGSVLEATRDGNEVLMPRAPAKTGMAKNPGVAPIIDGPMI